MTRMYDEVKIDNVDVTSYRITWVLTEEFGFDNPAINICNIEVSTNIFNVLPNLSLGSYITIKRGFVTPTDWFEFEGTVISILYKIDRYVITCYDLLFEGFKKKITSSWDRNIDTAQGVGSEIFKELLTDCNLSYDATSIESTGTLESLRVQKFIAKAEEGIKKMQQIANIYGMFITRKPSTGFVYLKKKGYEVFPITLNVGVEISNELQWNLDMLNLRNKITVKGASQKDVIKETFTADTAQTTFELSKTPEETQIDVDGVRQVRGILTSSTPGTFQYSVDKDTKTVTWVSAFSGGESVVINYGAFIPVPIIVKDINSINTYGGPYKTPNEYEINTPQIVNAQDAELQANDLKNRYAVPGYFTNISLSNTTLETNRPELGQIVNVIDSRQGKTATMLINKMQKTYPHLYDQLGVGNQYWQVTDMYINVSNNLRSLMETLQQNQDILIHVLDGLDTTYSYETRYLIEQKQEMNYPALTGIFDDDTNGILGTNQLNSYTGDGFVTSQVIQHNGIYVEDFHDTDFKDTTLDTGYWDTTNKRLAMTSSTDQTQVYNTINQSEYIFKNLTTPITKAKLTGDETKFGNDTVLYYLSNDGKNTWEPVTNNVSHTFTNSGLSINWRILFVGNGANQTYIENLEVVNE